MDHIKPSSRSATVRAALVALTGNTEWEDQEYWDYFLTTRQAVFKKVAKTSRRNWNDPDVGRKVDAEFILQARGVIPEWAESMLQHPDIVRWMRHQHWKNIRNKPSLVSELELSSNTTHTPPEANGSVTGSSTDNSQRRGEAEASTVSAYWKVVL